MLGSTWLEDIFRKAQSGLSLKLKVRAWRGLDSGFIFFCIRTMSLILGSHLDIFFWSRDSRSRDFRPTLFSFILFQSENKTFLSNFVTNHSGNGTETFVRWRNLRAKNFKVRSIFWTKAKQSVKPVYPPPPHLPLSRKLHFYFLIYHIKQAWPNCGPRAK